jgi:hypothetical protein
MSHSDIPCGYCYLFMEGTDMSVFFDEPSVEIIAGTDILGTKFDSRNLSLRAYDPSYTGDLFVIKYINGETGSGPVKLQPNVSILDSLAPEGERHAWIN